MGLNIPLRVNGVIVVQETFDNDGGQGAVGDVFTHDLNGLVLGHAFPVRTLFRDGGKDVRAGHDAGAEGDLVRRETERIAVSVQLFMMEAGPEGNLFKPLNVLKEDRGVIGVFLDDVELLIRQAARLFQDFPGDFRF